MNRGRLFVISAPSGAGKTTILKKVMARIPRLVFSISHTTRKPRQGEVDGRDYFFTDRPRFFEMVAQDRFLEHAEVHGNLYGTSRQGVEKQLGEGTDVILDIDDQGAAILRKSGLVDGAHIFIAPPGLTELERRLRSRGTESEEQLAVRLANAKLEIKAADEYDYLVVNDRLNDAVDLLCSIIVAERARFQRLPSGEAITGVFE
jgi:guanylate kinase